MNRNEVQGKLQNGKGRVKEAVGAITGNRKLENEGAAQRTAGAVQETIGKASRKIGEAVTGLGKAIKK